MRILLINYEYPPVGGGAGRATAALKKEFKKLGHEVYVLTSKRRWKGRSSIFQMSKFIVQGIFLGKKIVQDFRPDAVISFFAIPSGLIAYFIKKRFKIPYAISLRGSDVPGFEPDFSFWYRLTMPLTKIIWKNAGAIVANSKGLAKLAEKIAFQVNQKVQVIPNGIAINRFKVQGSRFKTISQISKLKRIKILFVGRLVKQKNLLFLLEAFYKLKQKVKSPLILDIVGDGPMRKSLKDLRDKLGLKDAVIFNGWLTHEEVMKKYQRADIFVLPSLIEGMPNVVLEAMATGVPVVVSDVSGNRDLITNGKNGFLFNLGDKADFIAKCQELIEKPILREKFAKIGLETAKKYSWQKTAKEYLKIIKILK